MTMSQQRRALSWLLSDGHVSCEMLQFRGPDPISLGEGILLFIRLLGCSGQERMCVSLDLTPAS